MRTITYIGVLMLSVFPVVGSEDLRDGAVNQDRILGELVERFGDLKAQQEDSNVFSEEEVQDSNGVITRVSNVRQQDVAEAIEALDRSVSAASSAARAEAYATAKTAYDKALVVLSAIAGGLGGKMEAAMEVYDILDRQQELLEELKEFEEQYSEGLDEAALNELAELADDQEDIAESALDQDTKQQMEEARQAIEDADVEAAIEKQEQIVEQLKDELGDMKQAEAGEASESSELLEALTEMNEAIEQMREALQEAHEATDSSQKMSAQERQEMAEQMNEMAEALREGGQMKADNEIEKAMLAMLENQDQSASESLAKAQKAIHQTIDRIEQGGKMDAKLAAMKQSQGRSASQSGSQGQSAGGEGSESMTAGGESERVTGLKYGKTRGPGTADNWRAGLPEKERSALQAARKAKYAPEMEEDVRKYFVLLARDEEQ